LERMIISMTSGYISLFDENLCHSAKHFANGCNTVVD